MPKICFKKSNLLEQLDKIPPAMIRFLARNPDGTAPTNAQIAKRSGMDKHRIHRICRMKTWSNLKVRDIDRFCSACGWDISKPNVIRRFVKKSKFAHAQKANPRLRRYLTSTITNEIK